MRAIFAGLFDSELLVEENVVLQNYQEGINKKIDVEVLVDCKEKLNNFYSSLNKVIREKIFWDSSGRLNLLWHIFLTQSNVLDDKCQWQLDSDHDNIDRDDFFIERSKLLGFNAVADTLDETDTQKEIIRVNIEV